MHARKHQMRRRRADVDADGRQLDVVGRPDRVAELLFLLLGRVQVIEAELVQPGRGRFASRGMLCSARLIEVLAHARLHAVFRELFEIELVNTRVLMLVLDLRAAVANGDVDAFEELPLRCRERVSQAA